MAYPEILPNTAALDDPGHIDDHNQIVTAVRNIDNRLRYAEISLGTLTVEGIQDIVGGMIQPGSNVTVDYNDVAGTLTISGTGSGSAPTREEIEDLLQNSFFAGSGVSITYDDAGNRFIFTNTDGGAAAVSAHNSASDPHGDRAYTDSQVTSITPAAIGAATAAQGSLAATAVQPGDDAADLGAGASLDGQVLTSDGSGGSAWETPASGVTDHSLLLGLTDDDHPQYALTDGSRGSFATPAQGALADTAVQPADLAVVATSGDYNDLLNRPDLASVLDSYWTFSTSTVDSDPGKGKFRLNAATRAGATFLYLDDLTVANTDISNFAAVADVGDTVFVQARDDATSYVRYVLTGMPTHAAGYWKFPVDVDVAAVGPELTNNMSVLLLVAIAALGGGSGSASDEVAAHVAAIDPHGDRAYTDAEIAAITPASINAATAAQGATADSAVQPGDLATVATTGAYADLSGTPTIPDLNAHTSDPTDAHDASAISTAAFDGNLAGASDVQGALDLLDDETFSGGALDDLTDVDTTGTASGYVLTDTGGGYEMAPVPANNPTGYVEVTDFGAVADCRPYTWGTLSNGGGTAGDTYTITDGPSAFTADDVGVEIHIEHGTTSGDRWHRTTIASYVNPTTVRLTTPVTANTTGTDMLAVVGTDNDAAFDAAIAALEPGNTLYFPTGAYLTSGTYVLPFSRMIGGGQEATTIVTTQTTAGVLFDLPVAYSIAKDFAVLYGGMWTRKNPGSAAGGADNPIRTYLTGIRFGNTGWAGVQLENVKSTAFDVCFHHLDGPNVKLVGCLAEYPWTDGFLLESPSWPDFGLRQLDNCRTGSGPAFFNGRRGNGIRWREGGDTAISDCLIQGQTYGIHFDVRGSTQEIRVTGCGFEDAVTHSIYVNQTVTSGYFRDAVFADNTFAQLTDSPFVYVRNSGTVAVIEALVMGASSATVETLITEPFMKIESTSAVANIRNVSVGPIKTTGYAGTDTGAPTLQVVGNEFALSNITEVTATGGQPPRLNNYFGPKLIAASTSITVTASRLYYTPFVVHSAIKIDQMAVYVNTGVASSTVRMGIYRDNEGGGPRDLIADYGTVATATSSALASIAVDTFLPPGRYWAALGFSAHTPALRGGIVEQPDTVNDTAAGSVIPATSGRMVYGQKWDGTWTSGALPVNSNANGVGSANDSILVAFRRGA